MVAAAVVAEMEMEMKITAGLTMMIEFQEPHWNSILLAATSTGFDSYLAIPVVADDKMKEEREAMTAQLVCFVVTLVARQWRTESSCHLRMKMAAADSVAAVDSVGLAAVVLSMMKMKIQVLLMMKSKNQTVQRVQQLKTVEFATTELSAIPFLLFEQSEVAAVKMMMGTMATVMQTKTGQQVRWKLVNCESD